MKEIYQNVFQIFKVENSQKGLGLITFSIINNLHPIALGFPIPMHIFVPGLSQLDGWSKFGHD